MAVDDSMGQVLWTRHFLSAQGVHVPTTTIYQDNMSTILLAENGRSSSSKRTRHINVRYYFVTDQVKKGYVKIAYCPTENMLGDFFTKPLQGNVFKNMRKLILNMPDDANGSNGHRSVLETDKKTVSGNEESGAKKSASQGKQNPYFRHGSDFRTG